MKILFEMFEVLKKRDSGYLDEIIKKKKQMPCYILHI